MSHRLTRAIALFALGYALPSEEASAAAGFFFLCALYNLIMWMVDDE